MSAKTVQHSKAREKTAHVFGRKNLSTENLHVFARCRGAFYIIGKYKMIEKADEGHGDKILGYAPNKKEIKMYSTRLSLLKNSFIYIIYSFRIDILRTCVLRQFIRFRKIRIYYVIKNIYQTYVHFYASFPSSLRTNTATLPTQYTDNIY